MSDHAKIFMLLAATLIAGTAAIPFIPEFLGEIKQALATFKQFYRTHPTVSYLLFGAIFATILLLGLPFTCAAILIAGITYKFWEAALLIAVLRIGIALTAFIVVRHIFEEKREDNYMKPALVQKLDENPILAYFLMRLAPLPDNTVNCAMGTSSIRGSDFVLITLLTLVPSTLIWVSIGNSLGNINELIRFLN